MTIRFTLLLLTYIAIAWFIGLVWFIKQIPQEPTHDYSVTDGIVVLTGGSIRLSTALDLLHEHHKGKLLISGVGKAVTIDNLEHVEDITEAQVKPYKDRIVLGYIATNTRGNAKEAAIWADLEGYQSLRVVTANYHIPRSMLEFSYAMPGRTLIPHPVFPERVKVREWWQYPGSALLIISEYTKYLGSLIYHKSLSHM